ncbi:TonB-dependent receptor [candidate division KSB1 bacterium]|nr:TonB-dependent receptor [candidate division KSB1 bacterium]
MGTKTKSILKIIFMLLIVGLLKAQPLAEQQSRVTEKIFDIELEKLMEYEVITASQIGEKIISAPSNITVITARQIAEWGSRDLKDVLRRVAGYPVIPDRDEWIFGARGKISDNNQSYLILIDGHRMNSLENFGPGQVIDLPNDLSNVRHIEIIRGPGSVVWGSDAMAGVINIITKNADDFRKKRYHVSTTIGQDGNYRGNFQFGLAAHSDVSVLLMGSFAMQGGRQVKQSAATTLPILESESGFTDHPFGTYTTALEKRDPGYMLHFKGHAAKFSINAYVLNTAVYNRHFEIGYGRENYLSNYKTFMEGIYQNTFFKNLDLTWKISSDLNRAEYFPKMQQPFVKKSTNVVWLDRQFRTSLQISQPLNRLLTYTSGLDFCYSTLGPNQRLNEFDFEQPKQVTDGFWLDHFLEDRCFGAYFLLNMNLTSHLKGFIGSRFDYNQDRGIDDFNVSPRVCLLWQTGDLMAFKFLYNRGFMRPSNFQSSGAAVKSETIDQVDFIWLLEIKQTTLALTAYWQRLRGLLNIVTGADYKGYANSGDCYAHGIEIEFNTTFMKRHHFWWNGTYGFAKGGHFSPDLPFNARRVTSEGHLLNYPDISSNLGATFRFFKNHFFISPAIRFIKTIDYRITPAIHSLDDAKYGLAGPFTYFDVNIGLDYNQKINFSIYCDNLTNITSPMPLSIWNGTVQQYGRYIEGKIQFHW